MNILSFLKPNKGSGDGFQANQSWDSASSQEKGRGSLNGSCTPERVDSSSDAGGKVEGQPERKGSTIGAFLNIVCVIVGTGSLQLPLTFKQAGWIGILLVIISGMIGTYTGVLVIRSLQLMDSRIRNFNQIGQSAFGWPGRFIIYFFHTIYVIGIVCDYIILSGQSFNQIAKDNGTDIGEKAWMAICTVIMWLACVSLKQMSEAAILSFFGFSTSFITIIIAIVESFKHPYKSDGAVPFEHHPAEHHAAIGDGISIAMASISFSFCAVVVMPSVEASMKRPEMWNRVVGSAMSVVTCVYIFIATVGYWAFGDQAVSPMLDNLPQNTTVKAAKVLISLHVIFASPVMATSLALELEMAMKITKERFGRVREFLFRFAFRSVFFGIMYVIAIVIPYFGDVMSLVGAFSTSLLLCVIPVACYIKLRGWKQVSWYIWPISVAVVGIGIYTCIMGAKSSVETLQEHIREDK